MASLFALGVMSIVWMAFVAGLIAVEKTLPWRRVATYGTAAVLLALGVLLLVRARRDPGAHDPWEQSDAPDGANGLLAASGNVQVPSTGSSVIKTGSMVEAARHVPPSLLPTTVVGSYPSRTG